MTKDDIQLLYEYDRWRTTGFCKPFPFSALSNSPVIWVAAFVPYVTLWCTSSAANGVGLPTGKRRPIAQHS